MSAILEFILQLIGENALHSGFWRFFLCLMAGFSIAGIVWWKMGQGPLTNTIAVGTILTMSVIGVFWARSAA